MTATGNLTVANAATSVGNIRIVVAPHGDSGTDYAGSLIYTNRTGKSYMKVGSTYQEVAASTDYLSTATNGGEGQKQGKIQFDVTIVQDSDGTSAPTSQQLAAVAGTYIVRLSAGGSVKLSGTATAAYGTDAATPVYNFDDTGVTKCSGALGVAASQTFDAATIVIDGSGAVTFNSGSWSTLTTAKQTTVAYYGLEVLNDEAEASPAVAANSKITPSVA